MTRHVALLRGVNVGKGNRIAMAALRDLAAELGYDDVRTYINSGNLVLTSGAAARTVEQELSKAIRETLGLDIDVFVRTAGALEKVLADNPYPDGDLSQVTVAFLRDRAAADVAKRLATVAADDEPYHLAGREIYVHYGHGLGRSKLAEAFAALVGQSCTVRNLRTLQKIAGLC